MENANFLENLATRLGQNATVKNVYGDPIVQDGKTIIPVAQVAYGFGGGQGKKGPEHKTGITEAGKEEEGAGGGGGLMARAKGVYEVSEKGTRFIPANNTLQLMAAALLGFLVGTCMKRH